MQGLHGLVTLPAEARLSSLCQDAEPPESERFGEIFELDHTTVHAQGEGQESVRYWLPEQPTVLNQLTLCRPSVLLVMKPGASYKTLEKKGPGIDALLRDYRQVAFGKYFYERVVLRDPRFASAADDEKRTPQDHALFGTYRNSEAVIGTMARSVTTKGGGQFKLLANFISGVAFQYWLIARKLWLQYTGVHKVGQPDGEGSACVLKTSDA